MELNTSQKQFIADIKERVRYAQYEALKAVNIHLIDIYWILGKAISEKQAEGWGKAIVPTLSKELQIEFPKMTGFSVTNLWYMVQFYSVYNADTNLQPLVGEISWSKHLVILSKCKDSQERQFYTIATKKFGWTKEVLIHQVENKTYERYLLNQTNFDQVLPEKVAKQAYLAVKDHYTFDLLNKGKMEFYLTVLNETVKLPHENPAIGIIICKSKNRTVVEYSLKTATLPIGVATYTTSNDLPSAYKALLPSAELISQKLSDFLENR
jgi:predicted nuclease of restriction endonuclease-like (RecB) superfamily